jgi:hypothetical protein
MSPACVKVASGGLAVSQAPAGFGVPFTLDNSGLPVTVVPSGGLPIADTGGSSGGIFPPPLTPATFNGTPSAGIVMSNGNLTVTHGTTNNGAGVFSASSQSSGKYYFEVTVQVATFGAHGAGIKVYAGGAFSDVTGTFSNGVGVNQGTISRIYSNAVDTGKDLGTTAVGDVFAFAVDLTARLAWIRRNNGNWNADAAANPVAGTNGIAVPVGAMSPMVRFTNQQATAAFTGNFGASAFAGAVPSGFTAGWPA